MVWGGQLRLMARALGVELDEIRETVDRRPLDDTVETADDGRRSRPAPRARCASRCRASSTASRAIVIEHVTRIHPSCAPDWPIAAGRRRRRAPGDHRGPPAHRGHVEATDEGGNRAAGGNATAVGRLVNAIPWLRSAEPGLYDALDVPLRPAVGKLARNGDDMIIDMPEGKDPIELRLGRDGARHRRSPPRSSR